MSEEDPPFHPMLHPDPSPRRGSPPTHIILPKHSSKLSSLLSSLARIIKRLSGMKLSPQDKEVIRQMWFGNAKGKPDPKRLEPMYTRGLDIQQRRWKWSAEAKHTRNDWTKMKPYRWDWKQFKRRKKT